MSVNLTDRGSMNRNVYVVMGVTGSGKSTVGAMLARRLGVDFVEGDDYHPPENVRRMASGIALTDADRAGWLRALAARIHEAKDASRGLVLTCSALKRAYRDVFRGADPKVRFVFLKGPESLIGERIAARRGHFMPASLLQSQLAILEEPAGDERAFVYEVSGTPEAIVDAIVARAT